MEFTTRFGLHSPNNPTPRRRRARTQIAAMGLTPAMGRSLDQKDAGDPRRAQDEFYTPQFRSAPKATGFGDGLIPLHSPLLRESSPKCKRRHTCRGSTTFAIDRGDLAKRGHLFEVDPPPPRSPIACRTLADFDGTAETQLRPSSTREPSDPPPRAIIVYRFSFYEAVATGLILSAERTISRPSLETARVLDARERLVPCRAPQRARLDLDKRERRPIVFSDTGPAVASRSGSNRRTSLNHSIGSSDGRKPESRSLSELTRQIAPPTKNGHAPPPTESRKSSQSVNPHCVRAGFATILPPEPKDFGFPKAAGEVVKVTPPDR
ncbi:unnamed protein product [Clavelina lepadiformis]|uniref:Uncharacterized protein n=1 Tax=Clavelina lepadiformis TaxID=159417 RepID=A0ABP0F364_CLALP